MMKNRNFGNITDLLDEKNISPAKRRRTLATAAALHRRHRSLIEDRLKGAPLSHPIFR